MDQTYIKVEGVCKYRYLAVGKQGNGANGDPDKVAMDKNGTNNAAIDAINAGRAVPPLVRHSHTSITSSNRITAPSSG
ncbi:hypothetical protein IFT64_06400 [Oxalobacteraceae sp. CFBP 8753]|nr:hypothetical protein [Oxalobacteraceae sp. CFBP 8753]